METEVLPEERDLIDKRISSLDENSREGVLIFSVTRLKVNGTTSARIVALTPHRIMEWKRGKSGTVQVRQEGHLLLLSKFVIDTTETLVEVGTDFSLRFQTPRQMQTNFTEVMWKNYAKLAPVLPVQCQFQEEHPQHQATELHESLMREYPPDTLSEFETFATALDSFCHYNQVPCPVEVYRASELLFSSTSRVLEAAALVGQPVQPDLMVMVFKALRYSNYFTELIVESVELPEDALTALRDLLVNSKTVKRVRMAGCGTSAKIPAFLLVVGHRNHSSPLTHLEFEDCAFGDKGVMELKKGISAFSRPLSTLSFAGAQAGEPTCNQLLKVVVNESQLATSLDSFNASHNKLGTKCTRMLETWLSSPGCRLRELRLSHCSLDVHGLVNALSVSNAPLRVLDVSGNKVKNDTAGLVLNQILCSTRTLSDVDVSQTGMSDFVFEAILAAMVRNVYIDGVRLNISGNPLGGDCAIRIASLLEASWTVEALKINDCALGQRALGFILHALHSHPSLAELEIDCNVEADDSVSEHSVDPTLATLVRCSKRLTRLSVAGRPGGREALRLDLQDLFQWVVSSESLRFLDISGNALGEDASSRIGRIIYHSTTIEELRLDGNDLEVGAFESIVRGLDRNKTLCRLPFPQRDFDRAREIATDMQRKRLRKAEEAIVEMTKKNAAMRQVKELQAQKESRGLAVAAADSLSVAGGAPHGAQPGNGGRAMGAGGLSSVAQAPHLAAPHTLQPPSRSDGGYSGSERSASPGDVDPQQPPYGGPPPVGHGVAPGMYAQPPPQGPYGYPQGATPIPAHMGGYAPSPAPYAQHGYPMAQGGPPPVGYASSAVPSSVPSGYPPQMMMQPGMGAPPHGQYYAPPQQQMDPRYGPPPQVGPQQHGHYGPPPDGSARGPPSAYTSATGYESDSVSASSFVGGSSAQSETGASSIGGSSAYSSNASSYAQQQYQQHPQQHPQQHGGYQYPGYDAPHPIGGGYHAPVMGGHQQPRGPGGPPPRQQHQPQHQPQQQPRPGPGAPPMLPQAPDPGQSPH